MASLTTMLDVLMIFVYALHTVEAETCISDCGNRTDGNYVLCGEKCEDGYYMSCADGHGTEMPCALGEYFHDNGTKYTARLIFDPSMGACMFSNKICSTPEFEVRSCLTYGCSYRKDGDYPLCGGQCFEGYYAKCENGVMKRLMCEVNPEEKLVFQPANKTCGPSDEICKQDEEIVEKIMKNKPTNCVERDCTGMVDGNYQICEPKACLAGYFVSCSNELPYGMECPLGSDQTDPSQTKTKKLIYDPATDTCEYSEEPCTAGLKNNTSNITACISICKSMPDGNYPLCGEQCNGYYASCSGQVFYKMECAQGWRNWPDGTRNLTRLNYDHSQDKCLEETKVCESTSGNMQYSTDAGERLAPNRKLIGLLIGLLMRTMCLF